MSPPFTGCQLFYHGIVSKFVRAAPFSERSFASLRAFPVIGDGPDGPAKSRPGGEGRGESALGSSLGAMLGPTASPAKTAVHRSGGAF